MKATIIVPRKEANYIQKLLTIEPTTEKDCFGEDETIVYTGYFDNGYSVDIKCCGVQYEEGNNNTAWTEAVWFDDKGREVACSDPCDDFLGEWEYYDFKNDKVYTVEVITEMKIAVTWEMCGYVDIPQAKSIEEAMKFFNDKCDFIELPDGEYIDGSFRLTTNDVEEMKIICE